MGQWKDDDGDTLTVKLEQKPGQNDGFRRVGLGQIQQGLADLERILREERLRS